MKPKPERKYLKRQLWKVKVGEACFEMVQRLCAIFEKHNPTTCSPFGYALVSSIAVTYAKPFTSNRIVGALSPQFAKFPTEQHRLAHGLMLELRNELYAHQDPKHAHVLIDIEPHDEGEQILYKFFHGLEQHHLHQRWIPIVNQNAAEILERLAPERDRLMGLLFGGEQHWPAGNITLNLYDNS